MKIFAAFLLTCAFSVVHASMAPVEETGVQPNARLATPPLSTAGVYTTPTASKGRAARNTPTQQRCVRAHVQHTLCGQRGFYRG